MANVRKLLQTIEQPRRGQPRREQNRHAGVDISPTFLQASGKIRELLPFLRRPFSPLATLRFAARAIGYLRAKKNALFPEQEVSGLLGPQRVVVEVGNENFGKMSDGRNAKLYSEAHALFVHEAKPSAAPKRLDRLKNCRVVLSQPNSELSDRLASGANPTARFLPQGQLETPFAIYESTQPMPKGVAVEDWRGIIGFSHDVPSARCDESRLGVIAPCRLAFCTMLGLEVQAW